MRTYTCAFRFLLKRLSYQSVSYVVLLSPTGSVFVLVHIFASAAVFLFCFVPGLPLRIPQPTIDNTIIILVAIALLPEASFRKKFSQRLAFKKKIDGWQVLVGRVTQVFALSPAIKMPVPYPTASCIRLCNTHYRRSQDWINNSYVDCDHI